MRVNWVMNLLFTVLFWWLIVAGSYFIVKSIKRYFTKLDTKKEVGK